MNEIKRCAKCKQAKSIDDFNKQHNSVDGFQRYCKSCQKLHRQENLDAYRNFKKIYRLRHLDATRKRGRDFYYKNQEARLKYHQTVNIRRRHETLEYISQSNGQSAIICVKCGFSDIRALQIDHKNSDGAVEKKLFGSFGSSHYHLHILGLEPNEIKNKYQILCANCNSIKRVENKEWRKLKIVCNDWNKS